MTTFVNIATLFVVGSCLGWVLEVFYRRIFSQKKWVNPGFMRGPYLPIYGFGVVILYGLCSAPILGIPEWAGWIIKILIIGVCMTMLELIGGLFFLKVFNMRLWDYSKRWGNYKGVICPLFSLIWMVIGAGFYYFLKNLFDELLKNLNNNIIYCFFIGIVLGMILVDAAYSLKVGLTMRKLFAGMKVRYDDFREDLKADLAKRTNNKKPGFAFNVLVRSPKKDISNALKKFKKKK